MSDVINNFHSLNKAQRKTVLKSWLCVAVRIVLIAFEGEEMELILCLQDIDFVQVRYKIDVIQEINNLCYSMLSSCGVIFLFMKRCEANFASTLLSCFHRICNADE